MEYEGAGSFWAQLSASQGGEVLFMARKIDELLKDQTSSLIDILSDDEVISEFRSANPKLVSRIVDTEGLKLLIDLITYRDIPDSVSQAQRLQLPFIATELVACEVDQLLDAFVREVPGHRSPMDRLFDFLIEGTCRDPTVLGYVSRVLSILISRRAPSVDKYIADSEEAIHHAFYDMCFDHSVCDVVIRLLIEDDVRLFPSQFSLFTLVSKNRHRDNTGLYVLDNVLNRPGVMHERIVQIFQRFERDARADDDGIHLLIDSALTDRDCASMDILSLLIAFCFKYSSFSEMSTPHWESFLPSSSQAPIGQPPLPFVGGQDDDNCVFDDEEPNDMKNVLPPPTLPRFAPTPFTDFGYFLVESISVTINNNSEGLVEEFMDSIVHLVSFLRLVSRVLAYSASAPKLTPNFVAKISTQALLKYPHSSAVHNLARDCLTCFTWTSVQLESIATEFVPPAVRFLEVSQKSSGGSYGHVCRILHHFVSELGSSWVTSLGDDTDMVLAASKRWVGEISVRLGGGAGAASSSSMSSPRTAGSIPIVDMDVPADIDEKGHSSPKHSFTTQLVIEEESEPWSSSSASQKMIRSNRSISDDENEDENHQPK